MCWLWAVDPDARAFAAFALRNGAWVLHSSAAGDARVRALPFDAVEVELSALWER